jgi:hypothetical protein
MSCFSIVAQVTSKLLFTGVDTYKNITKDEVLKSCRDQINIARSLDGAPSYENLHELNVLTRAQRIETLALEDLVSDGERFEKFKKQDILEQKKQFDALKLKFEEREKKISPYSSNPVKQLYHWIKSVALDVVNAHDYDSRFHDLSKVKPILVPKEQTSMKSELIASGAEIVKGIKDAIYKDSVVKKPTAVQPVDRGSVQRGI